MSDHGTRLAFVAEKLSGENRTNRTAGAATVRDRSLAVVQHWLLDIDLDRIAVGLSFESPPVRYNEKIF